MRNIVIIPTEIFSDGSMQMSEFERSVAEELDKLARAIDSSGLECDVEQKGDGILEITLDDGSRVIVNRNSSAGEIWVAAKSGGYHFRPSGGQWINSRNGQELYAAVSACLSEQASVHVTLQRPGQ